MDIVGDEVMNMTIENKYNYSDGNKLVHEFSQNKWRIAVTRDGQHNGINDVVHKIQMSLGNHFINVGKDGWITTNSSAVSWRLHPITIRNQQTHNGGAVRVQVPRRYMGVAQRKVQAGITEQKDLNRGGMFILGSIGPQAVSAKDLASMKEASDKCHEEDDQSVAYDDVTGSPLKPELVKEARKKEMDYFQRMGVY